MKTRITEADLQRIVDRINTMTGAPLVLFINGKWQVGNYHLAGAYGGKRLERVAKSNGAIHDVLNIGYVSKRELQSALFVWIAAYGAGREARMILSTDAIIHALRLSRPVAYLFPDDAARDTGRDTARVAAYLFPGDAGREFCGDTARAAAELAWGRVVHELALQLPVSARNAFLVNVQGEAA